MKIFRYIDFSVQTLLFIAAFVVIVGKLGGAGNLELVLWLQLFVGPWQLLSCVLSVGFRSPLYKLKIIHLVASIIYLTILFLLPYKELTEAAVGIALTVPAWLLALYYYTLTLFATFKRPARQSSFLPHTSF